METKLGKFGQFRGQGKNAIIHMLLKREIKLQKQATSHFSHIVGILSYQE